MSPKPLPVRPRGGTEGDRQRQGVIFRRSTEDELSLPLHLPLPPPRTIVADALRTRRNTVPDARSRTVRRPVVALHPAAPPSYRPSAIRDDRSAVLHSGGTPAFLSPAIPPTRARSLAETQPIIHLTGYFVDRHDPQCSKENRHLDYAFDETVEHPCSCECETCGRRAPSSLFPVPAYDPRVQGSGLVPRQRADAFADRSEDELDEAEAQAEAMACVDPPDLVEIDGPSGWGKSEEELVTAPLSQVNPWMVDTSGLSILNSGVPRKRSRRDANLELALIDEQAISREKNTDMVKGKGEGKKNEDVKQEPVRKKPFRTAEQETGKEKGKGKKKQK